MIEKPACFIINFALYNEATVVYSGPLTEGNDLVQPQDSVPGILKEKVESQVEPGGHCGELHGLTKNNKMADVIHKYLITLVFCWKQVILLFEIHNQCLNSFFAIKL